MVGISVCAGSLLASSLGPMPSSFSLLPTINRWSLLPQPKPSTTVVSAACQEV